MKFILYFVNYSIDDARNNFSEIIFFYFFVTIYFLTFKLLIIIIEQFNNVKKIIFSAWNLRDIKIQRRNFFIEYTKLYELFDFKQQTRILSATSGQTCHFPRELKFSCDLYLYKSLFNSRLFLLLFTSCIRDRSFRPIYQINFYFIFQRVAYF